MNNLQQTQWQQQNLLSKQTIKKLVFNLYMIQVSDVDYLPSYSDNNFKLFKKENFGKDIPLYVFKIHNQFTQLKFIQAENDVLQHVNNYIQSHKEQILNQTLKCSQVISFKNKKVMTINVISKQGENKVRYVRLIKYINGVHLDNIPLTLQIAQNYGKAIAIISKSLHGYHHKIVQQISLLWDLKNSLKAKQYLQYTKDQQIKQIIEKAFKMFQQKAIPLISKLRKNIIHNDFNILNVILDEKTHKVNGIIDFSDFVYSCSVFDLSIGLTYLMHKLDCQNIFQMLEVAIKSYNKIYPLTKEEISIIYTCICTRNAFSITMAKYKSYLEPQNQYILLSLQPAIFNLKLLLKEGNQKITNLLMKACGKD